MTDQRNAAPLGLGDYRASMAKSYRDAARLIDSATNLAYAAMLRDPDSGGPLFDDAENFGSTATHLLHEQARAVTADDR